MDPKIKSLTPSAELKVLPNEEHVEARQFAVNAERRAYVATLSKADQKRFAVMEGCVARLEKAGIPFFLIACPERERSADQGGAWQFNKLGYGDLIHSNEDISKARLTAWQMLYKAADFFSPVLRVVVGIYGYQGQLISVVNAQPLPPTQE